MMKKTLFLITFLLLLTFLLVGCMGKGAKDFISSEHEMRYYIPGDPEPKKLDVEVVFGRASSVDLTTENVTIDDYHTYAGLYTAPEGGECVFDANGKRMANSSLPSNGILYARGAGMQIEVRSHTYSANELQSFGAPVTMTFGSKWPDQLPVVEKEGYTFLGWTVGIYYITDAQGNLFERYRNIDESYIERGGLTVIRNQSTKEIMTLRLYLTPVLRENTATVTYDYNDGSYRQASMEIRKGKDISALDAPKTARDGFDLVGWSIDRYSYVPYTGAVTEDMTLYAIWQEYRYVFVTEWRGQERIEKVLKGDTLTLPTPVRAGYTFDGWYDNEACLGERLEINGPIAYGSLYPHYYVKWIPNE